MRVKAIIVVLVAFVILLAPISSVSADVLSIILGTDETTLFPIDSYYGTRSYSYEAPSDICVANDGTVFMVAFNPYWQNIRGATTASLIAWNNDGSVRWAERLSSFDRVLYDVETDSNHVVVVGCRGNQLFLAKYDSVGNQLWNITRSISGIDNGIELGYDLSLLEDGTIVACGISVNYSDYSTSYFLALFNQDGNSMWNQTFQSYISLWCDSEYIYFITDQSYLKRNKDGATLQLRGWSFRPHHRLLYVETDIVYAMGFHDSILTTSVSLSAWNLETEQEVWSRDFWLCDSDQQVYNCSGMDIEVAQDGSMMFLEGIPEGAQWHLLHINQDGKLASKLNHLNVTIFNAHLELADTGLAYIAGLSTTGNLTVSVFDTSDFVPVSISTTTSDGVPFSFQLSDAQLVGLVFAAVVLFDVAVILFLKKKY